MRVLLSAYACEPGKGSEPGVGWGWVENMSRSHTLWVVTRANNKKNIEAAADRLGKNVAFCYVDLPRWMSFWKQGGRGINLYYFLWQILAWNRARVLVKRHSIELAHHVTLMSATRFSFVPLLGIPSIVGPVGGLQQCPPCGWPFIRRRFREHLRTLSIKTLRWNPLFRLGPGLATRLVLATSSGQEALPPSVSSNVISPLQIAPASPIETGKSARISGSQGHFVILWSGRLEDHKGFEILIRAMAILKNSPHSGIDDFRVVVTGGGPEKAFYTTLIAHCGLDTYFQFEGWMSNEAYQMLRQSADVFVFTSLRETTGVSLQEAMLAGLPAVVIANGGPMEMVSHHSGMHVSRDSKDPAGDLAVALRKLYEDPVLRKALADNAFAEAHKSFSWPSLSERMTGIYHEAMHAAKRKK